MAQPGDDESRPHQSRPGAASNKRRRPFDGSQGDSSGQPATGNDIPVLEWIIAFVGLALVVGTVSFMVYQAIKGDSSPPDISLHVESISPIGNGYVVRIRAMNNGGSTAAGLTVEGALRHAFETVETSGATISYVPPHSQRIGGLFFTKDPRQFELHLRAKGYEAP